MGYGSPDPYYNPEEFDLTPVAEIDYSDGCYCFDLRVVWKHSSGAFYTMRDSGCSCPSPFEEYHSLEELDRLDLAALEAEVKAESGSRYANHSATVYSDFLREVREAVKAG